jgi:YbbR domain-containing protein
MLSLMKRLKIRNPLADKSPEDRTVLAICLGLAFVFWLLVKFSKEYTVVRTVSLRYELPQGKAFVTPPPESVIVNLTAQGWYFLVAGISRKHFELSYDVPDHTVFNLSPTQIRTDLDELVNDKEVEVTNLVFDGVRIALEEQEQVLLPIRLLKKLTFAEEHHLADSIIITPDSVWITGPMSQVASLTSWTTDSLLLGNLSKDYNGQLKLRIPEDGLRVAPDAIHVKIPVERFTEKSIFVDVEIVNPLADSIRLFPDKALIKCVIGLSHYNDLTSKDFQLIADLKKTFIREGKNTVPLELVKKPDYLHNALINPRATEFFVIKPTENSPTSGNQ